MFILILSALQNLLFPAIKTAELVRVLQLEYDQLCSKQESLDEKLGQEKKKVLKFETSFQEVLSYVSVVSLFLLRIIIFHLSSNQFVQMMANSFQNILHRVNRKAVVYKWRQKLSPQR